MTKPIVIAFDRATQAGSEARNSDCDRAPIAIKLTLSSGILAMTGPRSAGRPWTQAEVARLGELIASDTKVGLIARKLKRSPGSIYSRIRSSKKTPGEPFKAQRFTLPSERLAFAHANAQSRKIVHRGPLVEPGLKAKAR